MACLEKTRSAPLQNEKIMDAISNLIFNSLARHEGVRFTGIGSLGVVYDAASIDGEGRLVPLLNRVVFSKEEPAGLTSVVDLIEYSVGAGQGEAETLYTKWVEKMRGEDEIFIADVGEIKQDFFHISPKLHAMLNPVEKGGVRSPADPPKGGAGIKAMILWVVLAVVIGAAASIAVATLLENKGSGKASTEITARQQPAGNDAPAAQSADTVQGMPSSAAQVPAATPQPAAPAPARGEKTYYVVAGVFTVDSNADRFIAQAEAKGSTARFTKVPYNGKTLVSAYTAHDRAEADRMRRQLSDHLDALWVWERTVK